MLRSLAFILIVMLTPAPGLAVPALGDSSATAGSPGLDQRHQADSLLSYTVPEVVVTATRTRISRECSPAPISVLERSDLAKVGQPGVWAALSGRPGIYLRDLGGGNGLKTISVRGTASNQTLILLNGVPINSWQNGTADLGLVATDALERIEIVRGGQSALYGADAMAGAVNLITRPPADSISLSLALTAGSFGMEGIRAFGSGAAGSLSVEGGGGFEQSRGDFPYRIRVGERLELRRRRYADYRIGNGFVQIRSRDLRGADLSLMSFLEYGDRGSPGADFGGTAQDARLKDLGIRTVLQSRFAVGEGELSISVHHHRNVEGYEERAGPLAGETTYRGERAGALVEWHFALNAQAGITAGVEAEKGTLVSSALSDRARRTAAGGFLGGELYWNSLLWVRKLVVFPMLRYDAYSDVVATWSPKVGFNAWLSDRGSVQLRGSVGLSYRVPSFNELYWRDGGNPDLRHERAATAELGLVLQLDGIGQHRVDLSLFEIRMRDRITGWPPVNLNRATLRGAELAWEWNPGVVISSLRSAASLTRARDLSDGPAGNQLPYVPLIQGSVSAERRFGDLEVWLQTRFASRQFTTLDNAEALSSDPYTVVDASLAYRLSLLGVSSRAQVLVENLLNGSYEAVHGYPMPLRAFRLNITLRLQ